jgi:aryl-alcohol dehydrogenase-like predicted oxidoreductase
MEMRNLGSAGLVSSAIGLGTQAFTGAYGSVTRRESEKVIRLALDTGITMFETADFQSNGDMERLLGEALSGRRDDALIATCGGVRVNAAGADGDPTYLARACDASLRRLRTDHIDLFYLSRIDQRVPVEDTIGKLAELVAAGKIRYLGLRAALADQLRRAQATHPISVLAVECSLLRPPNEKAPLALAAELGVGIVACCPLGRGLLTGGSSARIPARLQAALRTMEAEAAELDLGIARLALAWLLAWRGDVVPVPSTRSPAHIEMNASVPQIRLPPDTYARLAHLFSAHLP